MKNRPLFLLCSCALLLFLQACSQSTHPVNKAVLGKASSSSEMEQLIDQAGPIELESVNSADWSVPLSGLVNLKSAAAVQAGLVDRDEPIQIYAHILKHPQFGNFLVDTGVSQAVIDDAGKVGVNWLIRTGMHTEKMKLHKSTGDILHGLDGTLSGVFFTHLHIDHIFGMPDISSNVPLYIGAGESTATDMMNIVVQSATDQLFSDKQPFQEIQFQPDPQNKFAGILDIFGDGSAFAISVPGHTPGSIAYLIRSTHGPVLLTGDTSHTRWGWEHAVEPGDFTKDHNLNLINLKRLKDLVARHPQIEVRFGHQR